MPSSVEIRPARAEDDAEAIAKYLYLTDQYIYPALCPSYTAPEWVGFVRANLGNGDHFFAARNLLAAECGGRIIGLCCFLRGGAEPAFLQNVPPKFADRFRFVDEGYFAPLAKEIGGMTGLYVADLCVDPDFRGNGVGFRLLEELIRRHPQAEIRLDVLEGNAPAIGLYGRVGFLPCAAHPGFGGEKGASVPCLSMVRPPDETSAKTPAP